MGESTSSDPVVQLIDRATVAGIARAASGATAALIEWRADEARGLLAVAGGK
jgi:hypothetical protein